MGQYYIVANLDQEQYLDPHTCGDLAKLLEFTSNGCGMLACLGILLADGNGRGGGDLLTWNHQTGASEPVPGAEVIGSWAGDRIVIAGDYADPDSYGIQTSTEERPQRNLYDHAGEHFENVSAKAVKALCGDSFFKEQFEQRLDWRPGGLAALLEEAEKPQRRKRKQRVA